MSTDLRTAAQQALEALQAYGSHAPNCDHLVLLTSLPPQRKPCSCGLSSNITALKAALAEQAEPVAWMYPDDYAGILKHQSRAEVFQKAWCNPAVCVPLYTTPPPRYNRSPHDLTEFVNYLCEISNKFAGTTQLNDRITTQVLWYLKHTDPLPPKF